jgi:hypothetical protein
LRPPLEQSGESAAAALPNCTPSHTATIDAAPRRSVIADFFMAFPPGVGRLSITVT